MKKIIYILSLIVAFSVVSCTDLYEFDSAVVEQEQEQDPEEQENEDSDVVVNSDGYIEISTAEQFAKIGVDSNYPLDGDYILTESIDFSDYGFWTPIGGSKKTPFTGTFDGEGCTIAGLSILYSEDSYVGLFGYVEGGSISNLIIKDAYVKGNGYVSAVCGYITSGSIEKCGVEGGSVSGDSFVGSVVGLAYSSVTITSCYNTGSVSGSGTRVGGVVGCATSTPVIGCYNTGSVSGSDDYVGGVAGYASYSVIDCYNTGDVSGGDLVGGVVGRTYFSTPITSCYNTGDVSGNGGYVGGVVGYAGEFSSSSTTSSVTSCYNMGDISGGGDYVGGVVGRTSSPVTITSCNNTGDVFGSGDYVGGVVGSAYSSSPVTSCYNTGDVSGSGDYVGGVVGSATSSSPITSCYNTSDVSGSGNSVGGVVGYASSSYVIACYNTGGVSGRGEYIGSVIGYAYSSVTSCYFIDQAGDDATTGIGNGSGSATALDSVLDLNHSVWEMNEALQEIDIEDQYTAGSPTDTNLPHLMGENLLYVGTDDVEQETTTWMLSDFSSNSYPTDTDTWTILDEKPTSEDFSGFLDALQMAVKEENRDISAIFPNMYYVPSNAFADFGYLLSSLSLPKAEAISDWAFDDWKDMADMTLTLATDAEISSYGRDMFFETYCECIDLIIGENSGASINGLYFTVGGNTFGPFKSITTLEDNIKDLIYNY